MPETVHLAIAVNDRFAEPAAVMLYSLFARTQSPVCVHLLCQSLSRSLRRMTERFGQSFEEIPIDADCFRDASLADNTMYSVEIYYRILIPYLIPAKKVLWLDADLVLTGDVAALYETDLMDAYCAAVTDIGEEQHRRDEIKAAMGITSTYFNSGVLLLHAEKIRREIPREDFFAAVRRFSALLTCPDQDILNYMFRDRAKILPKWYNDQHHLDEQGSRDSLIVHYIWMKPWDARYSGKLGDLYWENAKKAGFSASRLRYRARRFWHIAKTEYLPRIKRILPGKRRQP